jgi:thymidylate synthase (FAD)
MRVELMAITPNAEEVIEDACRTCYLSFHRKSPPESTRELIGKIIEKGHHSVLEHASATFRVLGASRVFTHEMVRHRFVSPSQQSQRYVNEEHAEVILPPSVAAHAEAKTEFDRIVDEARQSYARLRAFGVPREDARYVLPGGVVSEIVLSANLREWRHVFEVRCHPRAHWEIRQVCLDMLRILKHETPIVFDDFLIDEERRMASLQSGPGEAVLAAAGTTGGKGG